jgi:hypothetical protein
MLPDALSSGLGSTLIRHKMASMLCPECGAAEQNVDAYCKRCGKYLPDTSLRGRLLGGYNPEKTARSIAGFSILVAFICVIISFLILSAEETGNKTYLKFAFVLCWAVIGYLITLSLVCLRLLRRMKSAQAKQEKAESIASKRSAILSAVAKAVGFPGVGDRGEAATEPLNSSNRGREQA